MNANKLATLSRIMKDAQNRDLVHHMVTDEQLDGRTVQMGNQTMKNFGSCSYLSLEHHEALNAGTKEALDKFGTQFSSSRAFAALSLYHELESHLETIFGNPVIATSNTTLGHQCALPVIVGENDAVILDLQVHTSVQTAVQLLKADGVHTEMIRHNSMEALERKIKAFKGKYDKVWYMADGVYSIFGDSAPLKELEALLDKYEHFHLYIDDAHGMGWTGENGMGWVRSKMEHHDRMVLAVSLNKSFACAGGCLIFPTEEMRDLVKNCGGPIIFSGPIQPPMLGAGVASAKLHMSEEIKPIQDKLAHLIQFANDQIKKLGLPQYEVTETPLFFVPLGLPKLSFNMIGRLKDDGFYTHAGSFPATPMKQSGLRFMINACHTEEDVLSLLERVRYHYPLIVEEEGSSCAEIAKYFGIEPFEVAAENLMIVKKAAKKELHVEVKHSIEEMDQAEWDSLFGGHGNLTVSSLRTMEAVFKNGEEQENQCDFYYLMVRDEKAQPVLATFFTHAVVKDDIFAPASVSEQIEKTRKMDPLFLTSSSISLGAPITKGNHLHLDMEHAAWKEALQILIKQMETAMQTHGASQMMIREFMGEENEMLTQVMYDLGFTAWELPEVSRVENIDWNNREEFMQQRLSSRYRSDLRREVLKFEDKFEVVTTQLTTEDEIEEAYELYMNVYERSLEMNVFPLPMKFFQEICANPDYDVIRMYLKEDLAHNPDAAPVAVMFSYAGSEEYTALIVGLDYDYVRSHNTYKQILFQTVERSQAIGCSSIDLAFTANSVKKKVGATKVKARAYVQILDHFNMSVISNMTKKVG